MRCEHTRIDVAIRASLPSRRMSLGHMSGFSLLEVMVAVAVLSTALLGLAFLQVLGLRSGNSAYHRSQATVLAYDMGERMRASPADAASYVIPLTGTPPPKDGTKATESQHEWIATVARTLPSGQGSVEMSAGVARITVQWADNSQDLEATIQSTIYSTRL